MNTYKRKRIVSLILVMFLILPVVTPFFNTITAYAETYKVVIIGDSRIVQLGINADGFDVNTEISGVGKSGYYYRAKGSMGYDWMVKTAIPDIKDKCDSNTTVYVVFGVNDITRYEAYKKKFATLSKELNGATIKVGKVGKGDSEEAAKNRMSISNDAVDKFNNYISDSPSGYTVVTFWAPNEEKHTVDGVHYTKDFYIQTLEQLKSGAGGSDTGSSGSGKMYDGKPLDNPVCDSGFDNSFDGATYYDMTIPYTLTNEEIGGYADGKNGGHAMADNVKKQIVGEHWNIEGCHTSTVNGATILYKTVYSSPNIKIEHTDGFCMATDTNGTQYLILALPKYFYNTDCSIQWGIGNRGQIGEIYFTDNKYIRFIVGDAKAEVHTNGGKDGAGGVGTANPNDADDTYSFAKLNYPQYANIYQAYGGEVFEWFIDSASFNDVKSIAGSTGELAYVRMYNLSITDSVPTLSSKASKTYKGTRASKGSNISGSDPEQQKQANSNGYVGTFYSELELSAYNKLCEVDINKEYLLNATRDNLSTKDVQSVVSWRDNVQRIAEENGVVKVMRRLVMALGIFLTVYIILVYISYWVDRLNNFIEVDCLSILTLGKLRISDTEDECTYRLRDLGNGKTKTVNHRAILSITVVGLAFATLILTGVLFDAIMWLVLKVTNMLS